MQLKVRKFSRRVDKARFLRAALSGPRAVLDAPAEVDTTELESDLQGVIAMLRAGELTIDDLVNDGSGWAAIGEFCPLEDEVVALGRPRRSGLPAGAIWYLLLSILVLAAAIASYIFLQVLKVELGLR